ncbi:MAG: YdbL family protein [Salinisphaeraceae bacterium]|nr:YdbL family protein [Salinisphaeraceae bacterium]
MKTLLSVLTTSALIAGCVTINVYFPAVAAEKAADRIIDEVWGEKPQGTPESDAQTQPQSSLTPDNNMQELAWRLTGDLLSALVSPAHAAADIDISSPAVQQIKASMEARHNQLAPHYSSGAIGLTNNGEIALRDPNAVPLQDRNRVKKLVADENADRQALYKEIAIANGQPDWADDIRATFAKRWISKAAKGWYYQDASGNWQQK